MNKRKFLPALFFILSLKLVAQTPTMGLIINDSAAYTGYTLLIPKNATSTYLIDNEGLLVHQWDHQYRPAMAAYLLENGNLLRSTLLPVGNKTGGFQEIDWDGTVVREYAYGSQHHDIEPLPNGNVLLITDDSITSSEAIAAGRDSTRIDGRLRVLHILEIATGAERESIVWEWQLMDHLVQDFDSTKTNYGIVAEHPELININFMVDSAPDWIHINSIDYNYELDQIVVSSRHFSEIWVIDHSTTTAEAASNSGGNSGMGGDIIYRWGNPITYDRGDSSSQMIYDQHDGHWVEPGLDGSGDLMVFSNGLTRPGDQFSTIEQFTPPVDSSGNYFISETLAFAPDTLTWHYQAEIPTDFYSAKYSGAQRLPNGNTLICSADGGILFEVTANGDLVWEYINPVSVNGPMVQGTVPDLNFVGRAHRYSPDYPGLAGYDLTPGAPIEIYLGTDFDNSRDLPLRFTLHLNYPNPFNPTTQLRYDLPEQAFVQLAIYDLLGRQVTTLVNHVEEPGYRSVTWNGTDTNGKAVSAGMYLYVIKAGDFVQTRKMILLK